VRRTIVADGLGMLAFPPQMVSVTQELGNHIMGAVVVAWIGDLPLERWGDRWLCGGSMSFRFRRHLEEGLVLSVVVEESEELKVEIIGEDGCVCSDSRMWLGSPAGPTIEDPQEMALVQSPLGVAELAVGTRYGSTKVDFDAQRDQDFLNKLSDEDLWQRLGIAHPAWLLSAANGLIRRAVALPLPNSAQAGVTITSLAPIKSDTTLLIDGQVIDLFEKKDRHFVVSRVTVRTGDVVAAVLDLTSCYW